jgi:cyclomaltodextrinase
MADTPRWVRDAVFYQIFPDRFAKSARAHKPGPLEPWSAPPSRHGFKGGDLLGIAEHLDHLEALGITAISLNPIFASASNHRYHTFDYRAIDPLLGGDAALRLFLDRAHRRGMRVILDGVFNHASRGFWPFNHVMENGRHSPYRDWFYLNPDWLASGRQLAAYPDRALQESLETEWADAHGAGVESLRTLGYRAWWDLPALPKLNTDNPEVRAYLYETAEHWLRFGADGWRLDVAEEIETPGFWEEFRRRVKTVNPEAYILAEVWDERPDLLTGERYDALMNYPFLTAVAGFAPGPHLDPRVTSQHAWLARAIRRLDGPQFAARLERIATAYRPEVTAVMFNLVDGHDTPRLRSMAGGDADAVRLAVLVQMTFPGAPVIYYGDEIGLSGEIDPGCRGGFPWDEAAWDHDLLTWFRDAIALRHANPVLRAGEFQIAGAHEGAVAYLRATAEDAMLVALNAASGPVRLPLADAGLAGRTFAEVPLAGRRGLSAPLKLDGSGQASLALPPRTGVVLRAEPPGR